MELEEFPAELLELIEINHANGNGFKPKAEVEQGGRNDHLFRTACKMRKTGMGEFEILEACIAMNKGRNKPPLLDDEVMTIVKSACKYEQGEEKPKKSPRATAGSHPMYSFAEDMANGKLGKDFIYSVQEKKIYEYADGVWVPIIPEKIIKILNKYDRRITSYTPQTKNQILTHFQSMNFAMLLEFNSTGYINLRNGMFDPVKLEFHPHEKKHLSTLRLDYEYNPEAQCPLWIQTLNEIMQGDKEKIGLFQEFVGYCLIPETKQKKALLLLGDTDCGKSTLIFVVKALIGALNCSSVALKNLDNPQFTPLLMNKLVNIDADVDKNAVNFEGEFKKITSGEDIQTNQKYVATFEFIPVCKFLMAANIFPKITDHSSAFYQRLMVIPLERRFLEKEKDRERVDKIKGELTGVFNWALEGLKRLRERTRFEEYGFIREAVQELEDENNPSNAFFDEHIEMAHGHYIEKAELFDKYSAWCKRANVFCLNKIRFSIALLKKFHQQTRKDVRLNNNGPRIWENIRYVEIKSENIADKGWQE